ncbi:MAG: hypothetical protein QOD00_1695 [Blastocatellia bacterium]|jgi:uncharacterized protein (TIGR02217 family)|nr:hypothetical protein [Blastocatellia bacterium]
MTANAFEEVRFPDRISYEASSTKRSRTSVVTSEGGKEKRNRRWPTQLREWDAARGIKESNDLIEVRDFHDVMDGRCTGFRFKDFTDYQAFNEHLDTSGGGPTYQLRKAARAGSLVKWRKIIKPVAGTVELTLNGQAVQLISDGASGSDIPLFGEETFGDTELITVPTARVDFTTGIITWLSTPHPGADDILLATFEFDVPVRFGSDEITVKPAGPGAWSWGSIPIKEVRQ